MMFTKTQWRILIGCFIAYTAAYIGRLNLSQAIPGITAALSLTGAQAGLMQTVFALTYAAGQLVNGAIVDRISAQRHILIGLVATSAINVLFGLANAYWLLLLLWAANGAAQSMLWTPIVKLIAKWYEGKAQSRVSFAISITLIAGHLLAWALSGYMAYLFNWRFSFIIPGFVVLALTPVALWLIRDKPDAEPAGADIPQADDRAMPMKPLLFQTGLWAMLLCCIANGFVRDGIMTWGPSMLSQSASATVSGTIGISLIIPLLNLLGILFGKLCYSRFENRSRLAIGVMMGVGGGAAALLWLFGAQGGVALALLLGACCALMYGINPILTTLVPMEYASVRRVALVAGLVDCFIYCGSSLAGVLTGAFIEAGGSAGAYISWILACALGLVFALLSSGKMRKDA